MPLPRWSTVQPEPNDDGKTLGVEDNEQNLGGMLCCDKDGFDDLQPLNDRVPLCQFPLNNGHLSHSRVTSESGKMQAWEATEYFAAGTTTSQSTRDQGMFSRISHVYLETKQTGGSLQKR